MTSPTPPWYARAARPDMARIPTFPKVLGLIAVLNWIVSLVVSGLLGGSALGTEPARSDAYFLTSPWGQTLVSEGTWLFSLVYSIVTMLLPFVSLWLLLPYIGRIEEAEGKANGELAVALARAAILVGSLFGLYWTYTVVNDAIDSVFAWLSLNS